MHTPPDWIEKTAEKARFVIDCHDGPNIWHRAKTPAYWLAKEFLDRQPLIAAAPALLEALDLIVGEHEFGSLTLPCDVLQTARNVIAAARGELTA